MAVPHVSGALALLLSRAGMTPQRAIEILLATADRSVPCGANSPNCVGRLDVAKAVAATGGRAPAVATTPRPTVPPTTARPAAAAGPATSPSTAPTSAAPPAGEAPVEEPPAPTEVVEEPSTPEVPTGDETASPPAEEVAQPSPIRPASRTVTGPAILAGVLLVGVVAASAATRRRARATGIRGDASP